MTILENVHAIAKSHNITLDERGINQDLSTIRISDDVAIWWNGKNLPTLNWRSSNCHATHAQTSKIIQELNLALAIVNFLVAETSVPNDNVKLSA